MPGFQGRVRSHGDEALRYVEIRKMNGYGFHSLYGLILQYHQDRCPSSLAYTRKCFPAAPGCCSFDEKACWSMTERSVGVGLVFPSHYK